MHARTHTHTHTHTQKYAIKINLVLSSILPIIWIGCSGKFGKSGLTINFVDGHQSFSHFQKIESHFGKKVEQLKAEDIH